MQFYQSVDCKANRLNFYKAQSEMATMLTRQTIDFMFNLSFDSLSKCNQICSHSEEKMCKTYCICTVISINVKNTGINLCYTPLFPANKCEFSKKNTYLNKNLLWFSILKLIGLFYSFICIFIALNSVFNK